MDTNVVTNAHQRQYLGATSDTNSCGQLVSITVYLTTLDKEIFSDRIFANPYVL